MPVRAKHFADANFNNGCNCPLAKAAKDFFKHSDKVHELVYGIEVHYKLRVDTFKHEKYGVPEFDLDLIKASQSEDPELLIRTIILSKN